VLGVDLREFGDLDVHVGVDLHRVARGRRREHALDLEDALALAEGVQRDDAKLSGGPHDLDRGRVRCARREAVVAQAVLVMEGRRLARACARRAHARESTGIEHGRTDKVLPCLHVDLT